MTAHSSASTILVIDDESAVRSLFVRWLTDAGFNCLQASGVDEALALFQQLPIAVATLDVRLPNLSGLELLPRIKQLSPDTEVIMLTGQGKTQTAISALTMGASGYLIKPVAQEELLIQVQKALERRQLLLDRRSYTEHLEAQVNEQTKEIRDAHEETIHRLMSACAYRDDETGTHIQRVGRYCEIIANEIGWPADRVDLIRMAAPMHDLGKIGIPDAILRKPGKLTADEYGIMKTHTVIGADLLAGSHSPLLQMAEQIARSHHERWNGRGYPAGLVEEEIPESARIVAIADVFDALTHDRVYRPAYFVHEAVAMIDDNCGIDYEPRLVDAFVRVLPRILDVYQDMPELRFAPSNPTPARSKQPAMAAGI
jgi:putative two-component system response regulator